ncbi:Tn3 family transposase [Micromonospora sp. STR1s_5]|nr:Tn3 family transposase [Micromonospora sp. STR1s_5]
MIAGGRNGRLQVGRRCRLSECNGSADSRTSSTRCSISTPARNRRWSPPTPPPTPTCVRPVPAARLPVLPPHRGHGRHPVLAGRPAGRAARRLRAAERGRPRPGQPRPDPHPLARHAAGGRLARDKQGPRLRPDPDDQPRRQPHPLGQAFAEYGRVDKTLHLLAMVDPVDETYRRRVTRQLNVQESRHRLARKIFHGQRGELRQAYREGQEDQLGALGLVLNAVVLWNTRYIDAAVQALRAAGRLAADDDVARLSPLGHEHINLLGRYAFPRPAAQPTLRALRDPDAADDQP